MKYKAEYRSHELFESVRPVFVERFLKYLKNNNHLYSDIEINMDNFTLDMVDLNNGLNNDNNGDDNSISGSGMILDLLRCQNEPISIASEIPEEGGLDDSLAQFKSVPDETIIVVTSGEWKQPASFLGEEFCEELAHPHLFPSESLAIKLRGKYQLVQVDILIKDF